MTTGNLIALLGGRGYVPQAEAKSMDEVIREIGDNTGNLVFQRAAARLVEGTLLHVGPGCEVFQDLTRVKTECGAIIFPAANHIDLRMNLANLTRWLGNLGHPVAVLGIGAQAGDCSDATFEATAARFGADAGFLQLMTLFRRPDVRVGVRGAFTRRLLERFDVPCAVTGCPSLLLNPSPDLGCKIELRLSRLRARLAAGARLRLAIPAASPWDGERVLAVERQLLGLLVQHEGVYIQQSGGVEALTVAARRYPGRERQRELHAWYEQRLRTGWGGERLGTFLDRHAAVFFDVDAWQRELETCSLSIGTRYHGSALAMQSGTPAVALVHDSRTEELCQSTGVPYLSLDAFNRQPTLAGVLAAVSFDGEAYDASRRAAARSVARMLEACGMRGSRGLLTLAGEG